MNDAKRGKFLQQLRIEKNLTQKELSEILHYSDNAISNWEKGKTLPNNPETLVKLCKIYNITIEELLYGERRNNKNAKEITNHMESIYSKNYKKLKIFLILSIFLILTIIIISLVSTYFIFIKGKILSYTIQGSSNHFIIDKSTILFTEEIDILNFNKIIPKNNEQIDSIKLYYIDKNDEEQLIFDGPNDSYYIEESKGYNEYNLDELMDNEVFLEIKYNDTLEEKINLILTQRFVNDSIFIKNKIDDNDEKSYNTNNKNIKEFLIEEGFQETYEGFEKVYKNQKCIYNLNIKKIYLFNQEKNLPEQVILDLDNNTLSYTFFNEKQDNYVSETFNLNEKEYIDTNIKFIDDNIDYLLYLKKYN